MKPVLLRTLLWLVLLAPPLARAQAVAPTPQPPDPLIVLSDTGGSYTSMLDALNRYTGRRLPTVTPASLAQQSLDRLLVAVGSRACEESLTAATDRSRLLCIYLPAQTFQELAATEPGRRLQAGKRLSAVYLDQPLARQIRLARLIDPDARSLGTVVGSDGDAQAEAFASAVRAQNLEPVIARLGPDDNPVQILTPVIERSDLFLPLPDRSVFNRAAAKWILYITLRSGVPLIGFSQKYADAGAVVALHSTNEQIARHSAELVIAAHSQTELPTADFPRYFSVSVNRTAARNLNLPRLDGERLRQLLQQQEAK